MENPKSNSQHPEKPQGDGASIPGGGGSLGVDRSEPPDVGCYKAEERDGFLKKESAEPGWVQVSFREIIEKTQLAAPELAWKWEKETIAGRTGLFLREPCGRRWQFRLRRGAWIREALLV